MAERPDLSSTSLGGIHDPYNTRSPRHKSATSAVRQSSGSLSLCITPSDHSLINKMLNWNKNMQLRTARSVVIDYSLKTPPVSARRGTPTGWFSNSSSCTGIQSKVFQSQVILEAPDEHVSPQRGLSGSKVRKASVVSRPSSRTTSNSFVADSNHEPSLALSPRPQSQRFSSQSCNELSDGFGNELLAGCKWNNSDQGLRLQHELSKLSSSRSMKRASAMVSHRVDQEYMLYGTKLTLQNRYETDCVEIQQQHQKLYSRERTTSPSHKKKIKFKYTSISPTCEVKTTKSRPGASCSPQTMGSSDIQPSKESSDEAPAAEASDKSSFIGCSDTDTAAGVSDVPTDAGSDEVSRATETNDVHISTFPTDVASNTGSVDVTLGAGSSTVTIATDPSDAPASTRSSDNLTAIGPGDTVKSVESRNT